MFRFKDVPIKIKMTILAVVPLIGLLYFSATAIERSYSDNKNMQDITNIVHFTENMSKLVHALQSERSVSTGFLASHGKRFSKELQEDRNIVNEELNSFKNLVSSLDMEHYSKKFRSKINNTLDSLAKISSLRKKIDTFSISLKDTLKYYENINGAFLSTIAEIAKISTDAKISMELNGYSAYALAKEKAADQEAALNYVFINNGYPLGIKDKVIALKAQEDRYMNSFIKRTDEVNIEFYQKEMSSSSIDNAKNLYILATKRSKILV